MKLQRGLRVLCLAGIMLTLTGCGTKTEYLTQGMEYIKALNYEEAITSFEQALAVGEDEKLTYRGMGIAYMGLTDYENAAVNFAAALHKSNGVIEDVDFDINLYLAAAYTKEGRYQEAGEIYDAVLALRPKSEEILFLRGTNLLRLGKYAEAKADFDAAVAMNDKDYDRLIQIYETLDYYGYKDAGQGYLTDALQKYGSEMGAYNQGRMYYYMRDYEKAYLSLEEAKDPSNSGTYLFLGKAYEATGDYNYASSVYNSYLTGVKQDAAIYNQLGLCEIKKGNYAAALTAFQNGMQLEDSVMMQTLAFNEIVAYEHMGEFTNAFALMENYLKTYPDDLKAKREYDFLSTR